jgi:hypothetical protein
MYADYMPADQVDETAGNTEMQGPSSGLNQLAGKATWLNDPTKCLVGLWFVVLAVYWAVGYFFRGQRS